MVAEKEAMGLSARLQAGRGVQRLNFCTADDGTRTMVKGLMATALLHTISALVRQKCCDNSKCFIGHDHPKLG